MTNIETRLREPEFDYPLSPYEGLERKRIPANGEIPDRLARVHLPIGGDAWLARRHAHAVEVMTHPDLSREAIIGKDVPRSMERLTTMKTLPFMDPPEHGAYRRMVSRVFGARRVESMRGAVEDIVDGLLDAAIAAGPPMDMVNDFGWPLPIRVISDLLGVPFEDHAKFREWTDASITVTAHSTDESVQAMGNLFMYFRRIADERLENPGSDLMSDLTLLSKEEETLTLDRVAEFGLALLIGGYESTANLFPDLIYLLLKHPDVLSQLQNDLSLVPTAVEECLRYIPFSASSNMGWMATKDIELGGVTVHEGDMVFVDHAAANMDPDVFDDPESFNIRRAHNPHLTFSHGTHRCLGAQLGRLEVNVAMERVLRRLPSIALAVPEEELVWKQGREFRSLERLPVTWDESGA